jgi:hypothetical protein
MQPVRSHEAVESRSRAERQQQNQKQCRDCHAPPMLSLEHPVLVENRINGRRLGTARPCPLWRLHSGPQSSSVDQYSETPPEHLESSVADVMRRSVVTHHRCRIKNLSFNDESNLAGQVLSKISRARPSSGGCAICHGSSMSPCTQGIGDRKQKAPLLAGPVR